MKFDERWDKNFFFISLLYVISKGQNSKFPNLIESQKDKRKLEARWTARSQSDVSDNSENFKNVLIEQVKPDWDSNGKHFLFPKQNLFHLRTVIFLRLSGGGPSYPLLFEKFICSVVILIVFFLPH